MKIRSGPALVEYILASLRADGYRGWRAGSSDGYGWMYFPWSLFHAEGREIVQVYRRRGRIIEHRWYTRGYRRVAQAEVILREGRYHEIRALYCGARIRCVVPTYSV